MNTMQNFKVRLLAAVLTIVLGVVSVWVGRFVSSLTINSSESSYTQADSYSTETPFLKQALDDLESSDQLPNAETDLGIFDPSGDYHPLDRPTDKSEQFIQFDLEVRRKNGKLVASGEVRGVQPWYKFSSVSITEEHLKFSTVKVRGVSYDFDGEFLGKGNFSSQSLGRGIVMLRGTLRKSFNGVKVMEVNTSFLYYPGC